MDFIIENANRKSTRKIGIVITGLGTGGAEKHLLKMLPKIRHEVFVVSLTNLNDVGKQLEAKGIRVYYLGMTKFNLLGTMCKLKNIMRDEKPDVVDSYLIHANILTRFLGKELAPKLINSVRNDYSNHTFLTKIDKKTINKPDMFMPNSRALIPYLVDNGVEPYNIKVLPNGIDYPELVKHISEKPIGKTIISCVARLIPKKNQECLMKALVHLPDEYNLWLIGDGSDRKRLEELADKLGISDRIWFTGQREDVISLVSQTNIFVLPSKTEGMSNALLEAMALGKVCIASDIPQNRVLLEDGRGILFPLDDCEDCLSRKIWALPANNCYGTKASAYVMQNHDIKVIAEKYDMIIDQITREKKENARCYGVHKI